MINCGKRLTCRGKIYWALAVVCAAAIFYFSAQPAAESNGLSRGIVKYIVDSAVALMNIKLASAEKWQLISNINSVGREYMHGVVFFVLGLTVHKAVTASGYPGRSAMAISLALCLLYALVDETHQLFVPGRAFQLRDLITDAVGSSIAVLINNYVATRKMQAGCRKKR